MKMSSGGGRLHPLEEERAGPVRLKDALNREAKRLLAASQSQQLPLCHVTGSDVRETESRSVTLVSMEMQEHGGLLLCVFAWNDKTD